MKVQSRFIEMFGAEDILHTRWPLFRMDEVFTISSSRRILKSEWKDKGSIPFIRVRDMVQLANKEPLTNEFFVSDEFYNSRPDDEKVKPGDIIVSATSTVGKTYIIKPGDRFYFKDADVLLFRKVKEINEVFFTYGLTMPTVWTQIKEGLGGTTVAHFLISNACKLMQPLPPLELQGQFSDIIQQADKSKFVGFKSRFIEMFGECQRKEKLSSLCETFIDGDWIESKDQSEDGIRLVQTGNVGYGYFKDKEDKSRYISEETFNRLHCTEIFAGDILVSRLPAPIGRACIIPAGIGRMITAVDCSIIRLKDIILQEYFISYTMTSTYSAQINEVTTGTTRRRVSRANLGNVLVPCPSLEAQRQFVAISQQADKSKYYYQIA